jgi:hypothetical protein
MSEIDNAEKDARVARANRLREEIEALKSGKRSQASSDHDSIKEQIRKRTRERDGKRKSSRPDPH